MRGVWTALVTPFDQSGGLDLDAFRKILRDQRDAGITGVIPCGTTGESPTLSTAEKKTLIEFTVRELKGSGVSVVAGTGSNNTAETVELSAWASKAGAQGVLIVTPYYSKPTPSGLEAHYRAVADAVDCEVMMYNVPGRTGVSLTAASIARIAAHPNVTSLKEATGNVAFASEVLDCLSRDRNERARHLDVLSGDDATYLPLLAVGAVGVVSVASNLFPRAMVQIQKSFDAGNAAEAQRLHRRFYPLFRDLFVESNPGPIKHAMSKMGWCRADVRAPLALLTVENAKIVEASMEACSLNKGSLA